jgi:putative addiction module component (TIGR02574 family)
MNPKTTSVFDLSPSEKLQLVQDLWDDLAASSSVFPLTDSQKEEIDRREARLKNNPASGLSWEEVKKRVRRHYGR